MAYWFRISISCTALRNISVPFLWSKLTESPPEFLSQHSLTAWPCGWALLLWCKCVVRDDSSLGDGRWGRAAWNLRVLGFSAPLDCSTPAFCFSQSIVFFCLFVFKSHNLLPPKPFISPDFFFLVLKIILFLILNLNKSFSVFQEHF